MNFDYTAEQKALKDEARRFLSARAPVSVVRGVLDNPDRSYDEALWQAVAEQGWLGTAIPEAYGGLGIRRTRSRVSLTIAAGIEVALRDRLAAWLRTQLPDADEVWIEGLDRIELGHSAEMLALTIASRADGADHRRDVLARASSEEASFA
jgi:alkylation response protein AidB-like acyl-CoA dehydrogenase